MLSIASHVTAFARYCSDFLLPPICVCCRNYVSRHNCLCAECWYSVKFIVPPICDRLGIPMPFDVGGPAISAAALAYPPLFDRARSVAHYEGPTKKLIHSMKYSDRHEGVKLFSRWMAQAGEDILSEADLIVPVPLSRVRLWSRRFNQASLLAQGVGASCNIPVDCLSLRRIKHTQAQVGLTRKQRQRNVSAAFDIDKAKYSIFEGKNIVLVDDVLTTGATLTSCTKVLKRVNANRVDVLTLARVVDPIRLGQ